ncbi:MAG: hypothetical protein U0930_04990 [Pirellulales bacterium]
MKAQISEKNTPVIELEYKDEQGQSHFKDVPGWTNARILARIIAKKTGRRVSLKPAPKRPWLIYSIAIDGSNSIIESRHQFTRAEAAEFWKQWKPNKEGSVCIPWPVWAIPIAVAFANAIEK